MKRAQLQMVQTDIEQRRPVATVTTLSTGELMLVHPGDPLPDDLAELLAEAVRKDRSGVAQTQAGEVFINVYNPKLRLVVIGAVHISQALIPMALAAGYDVTVIDPRTAFASGERFADVTLDARWPQEALPPIQLDRRTAFVALTHDPKIDDPALKIALAADCFYIGALGSSRTHAKRVERLTAAGVAPEALSRIRAPIGLDIGAIGAPEIAISIIAEITGALRGKASKRV